MAFSLPGLHDRTQTHHTRQDSFGRVISPMQRPLPDNTQHSPETETHTPAGCEPAIPKSERPQALALDRVATSLYVYLLTYSMVQSPS